MSNRKIWTGVYASDQLPNKLFTPVGLIINTDPSSMKGMHWVAIYINDKGKLFYFDSYGLEPFVKSIQRFICKNVQRSYQYNDLSMQGLNSNVCGQYCILFLYAMMKGKNMKQFQSAFQKHSTSENDKFVRFAFKKITMGLGEYRNLVRESSRRKCQRCVSRNVGDPHNSV